MVSLYSKIQFMTNKLQKNLSKINLFLIMVAIGVVMYALKTYQNEKDLAKAESIEVNQASTRAVPVFSKK